MAIISYITRTRAESQKDVRVRLPNCSALKVPRGFERFEPNLGQSDRCEAESFGTPKVSSYEILHMNEQSLLQL